MASPLWGGQSPALRSLGSSPGLSRQVLSTPFPAVGEGPSPGMERLHGPGLCLRDGGGEDMASLLASQAGHRSHKAGPCGGGRTRPVLRPLYRPYPQHCRCSLGRTERGRDAFRPLWPICMVGLCLGRARGSLRPRALGGRLRLLLRPGRGWCCSPWGFLGRIRFIISHFYLIIKIVQAHRRLGRKGGGASVSPRREAVAMMDALFCSYLGSGPLTSCRPAAQLPRSS